jgi:hypothetical protein
MAVPTRPVQDAIIDPVWGQWVHDHVAGATVRTTSVSVTRVTTAGGNFGMPKSEWAPGIATVQGYIVGALANDATKYIRVGTVQLADLTLHCYFEWTSGSGAAWNPLANWGCTAFVTAWGIPA